MSQHGQHNERYFPPPRSSPLGRGNILRCRSAQLSAVSARPTFRKTESNFEIPPAKPESSHDDEELFKGVLGVWPQSSRIARPKRSQSANNGDARRCPAGSSGFRATSAQARRNWSRALREAWTPWIASIPP